MGMTDLIRNYHPVNEQEAVDRQTILDFIERNPDSLLRTNRVAHLTSSAIIVNKKMDKILFVYHNIYQSWSWVGGHNDGDPDFLRVAIREAKEETGVKNIIPWSEDIFMIDIIYVNNHQKKGNYVSDHLHLNVTYLLIADENDELIIKADENSGVRWFSLENVFLHVSEDRMKPVYQKAMDKIHQIVSLRG
jgi:ADP-ribose pyrophosphatase YjhB (NUDIX family)